MKRDDLLEDSKIIRLFCRLNVNRRVNMPISSVEMEVLTLIYYGEGKLTPLKISEVMNLKKPSVTAFVESLVTKKYVDKHKNDNDKRSYNVAITDEGVNLLKEVHDVYLGAVYTLRNELGEDEFNRFVKTMEKANKILKEYKE